MVSSGHYEGLLVGNRLCFNDNCSENNMVEIEKHVLIDCPVYADLHCQLYNHACCFNCNFY